MVCHGVSCCLPHFPSVCCVPAALFPPPPHTHTQAVVNLDNVKSVPGLGKVTELPFVTQVLQGILPTIGEHTGTQQTHAACMHS
jgi:hypothetical protein